MHIPTFVKRHWLAVLIVVLLATPAAVFTVWSAATLNYSYAKGERAGFLQKISRRGWLCKTWEGELQLVSMPGTTPEKFAFSARSDSIAGELDRLSGQRVVLTYEQHKGVPGSCFGETEYYATGVRAIPPGS
jgi:hypothetical protein